MKQGVIREISLLDSNVPLTDRQLYGGIFHYAAVAAILGMGAEDCGKFLIEQTMPEKELEKIASFVFNREGNNRAGQEARCLIDHPDAVRSVDGGQLLISNFGAPDWIGMVLIHAFLIGADMIDLSDSKKYVEKYPEYGWVYRAATWYIRTAKGRLGTVMVPDIEAFGKILSSQELKNLIEHGHRLVTKVESHECAKGQGQGQGNG